MDRARPIYLSQNGKSPKFQAFVHDCAYRARRHVHGRGSVPQVFWGIPGLSPWGLGPAYIIHDWLFEVRRCGRNAPPEVKAITFEQSALILAEVGQELIRAGLIRDDMLDAIVWGVRTRYARALWDRPGSPEECKSPALMKRAAFSGRTVAKYTIPPRGRR